MQRVVAVVGAQYGSEGKGVIAAYMGGVLADRQYRQRPTAMYVRTGGPNAGHTVADSQGNIYKMRSLPVGFLHHHSPLVIGRAAVINPGVLNAEVRSLQAAGFSLDNRVLIDAEALVIDERTAFSEHQSGLVGSIGSTGEGVGLVRQVKLSRQGTLARVQDWVTGPVEVTDTVEAIHEWYDDGGDIILEGTQGFGLSLYHGPYWPYVTSRDCTASQFANDCGIPASWITDVVLVVRRYPIRVGGNSGPFDAPEVVSEISWEEVSRRCGRKVAEYTTVTGRLRRVAELDMGIVARAALVNGATCMAFMFADYDPGNPPGTDRFFALQPSTRNLIQELETFVGIPVRYIGTGRKDGSSGFSIIRR